MKRISLFLLFAFTMSAFGYTQEGGRFTGERKFGDERERSREGRGMDGPIGPRGPGGRRGAHYPMFEAIDTNGDQVITSRELSRAIKAIKSLDANGDGKITLAEASPPPRGRGPGGDPAQIVDRIMQNDQNGDGKLQPEEVPDRLMRMLRGGDANGDGAIDMDELSKIVEQQGPGRGGRGRGGFGEGGNDPKQFAEQLMQNDKNGDGLLSPEEVPERMMRMLRNADLNDDGYLNSKEVALAAERISRQTSRGDGFRRPNRRPRERDEFEPSERPPFD